MGAPAKPLENQSHLATNPVQAIGQLVPVRNGGKLRLGSKPGMSKAGPGRPSREWKMIMAALADRWAQACEAKKVLDNPKHPHWMNAGRFCAEQAYGQSSKRLELAGDADNPMKLIVEVVRETKDRPDLADD